MVFSLFAYGHGNNGQHSQHMTYNQKNIMTTTGISSFSSFSSDHSLYFHTVLMWMDGNVEGQLPSLQLLERGTAKPCHVHVCVCMYWRWSKPACQLCQTDTWNGGTMQQIQYNIWRMGFKASSVYSSRQCARRNIHLILINFPTRLWVE